MKAAGARGSDASRILVLQVKLQNYDGSGCDIVKLPFGNGVGQKAAQAAPSGPVFQAIQSDTATIRAAVAKVEAAAAAVAAAGSGSDAVD